MNLYWSLGKPIVVAMTTYIGHDADQYRFTSRPILLLRGILRKHLNPYRQEAEETNREETIKAVVTTDHCLYLDLLGRDEKTRTSDLHVPNVARYQLCYIPNALIDFPLRRCKVR